MESCPAGEPHSACPPALLVLPSLIEHLDLHGNDVLPPDYAWKSSVTRSPSQKSAGSYADCPCNSNSAPGDLVHALIDFSMLQVC